MDRGSLKRFRGRDDSLAVASFASLPAFSPFAFVRTLVHFVVPAAFAAHVGSTIGTRVLGTIVDVPSIAKVARWLAGFATLGIGFPSLVTIVFPLGALALIALLAVVTVAFGVALVFAETFRKLGRAIM